MRPERPSERAMREADEARLHLSELETRIEEAPYQGEHWQGDDPPIVVYDDRTGQLLGEATDAYQSEGSFVIAIRRLA